MAELKNVSFKEQAYTILKQKILHEEYKLGEKLNIDALAAELSVSNSPIREAITTLEREGLVTLAPNDGARVISFTEDSYVEMAKTIYVMLVGAYQLCVDLGICKQLALIMGKHLREQKKIQKNGSSAELVKCAILFDKSIITATNDSYLLAIYERIEAVFYLMALYNYRINVNPLRNITEHEMILAAIIDNKPDEVRQWLRIHYDKHI